MAEKYWNLANELFTLCSLPDMDSIKQVYTVLSDSAKYEWIDLACVAAVEYDGYRVHYDNGAFTILVDGATEYEPFTDREAVFDGLLSAIHRNMMDTTIERLVVEYVKTRAMYYINWYNDWEVRA